MKITAFNPDQSPLLDANLIAFCKEVEKEAVHALSRAMTRFSEPVEQRRPEPEPSNKMDELMPILFKNVSLERS